MNTFSNKQAGLTLVELMVALAIGSFLMIGAVQIYSQSRQAFVVNESIARVQETAQFAMDTIEADLRMASNWGRNSRPLAVEGRSIAGIANPNTLPEPNLCGDGWALDVAMIVDGDNNGYTLPCTPGRVGFPVAAQPNSDSFTVRRATVVPAALQAGRLQIQTTRIQGRLFADGLVPAGFSPADSTTHNLLVNSYYVAADSELIPGVPTLRRKSLGVVAGAPGIVDQEIAPGVENLQIQLGIDVDEDNTVDRYVNPGVAGEAIYDPAAAEYIPGARVMTARVWLLVRGVTQEIGIQQVRGFQPGDINLGVPSDTFRRIQVSKTILLRNART
ncbi:MAG: PilW family protein [Woeseiaceae bacterium]|nr:PilW family protein [Woeseiaceae bacterium]MDX2606973.1 PilW family protein [Woeseiaceae bacterium]